MLPQYALSVPKASACSPEKFRRSASMTIPQYTLRLSYNNHVTNSTWTWYSKFHKPQSKAGIVDPLVLYHKGISNQWDDHCVREVGRLNLI